MSISRESTVAHIALMVAQLSWSGFHIIYQEYGIDPLLFAAYREVLASVFMLGICVASIKTMPAWPPRCDYLTFVICGYCSFLNVVGSLFALQYLGGTAFAICQPLIPIVTAVLSSREEILGLGQGAGILMAVAGAIIAETQKSPTASSLKDPLLNDGVDALGYIAMSVQVTAMSTLIIIQRYSMLDGGYDSRTFTFYYYSTGTVLTLFFLALQETAAPRSGATGSQLTPAVGLALLYAATFATALAFNCITYAGKHLPSSTVTLYVCFQPLFTGIISHFALRAAVTMGQVWGALLVCAGLAVTVRLSPSIGANAVSASGAAPQPQQQKIEATHLYAPPS